MDSFVKSALLQAASNMQKVDVNNNQNLCDYTKIDVGFSASKIYKDLLSMKKTSDNQHVEIRMECRVFLQTLVQKLLSQSPVNYRMARYMAAFDPRLMALADKHNRNKTNFQRLFQELID